MKENAKWFSIEKHYFAISASSDVFMDVVFKMPV